MKKNNPFKVSDSYFDELENKILNQTTKKNKIVLIHSIYVKYAAACMFLIAISTFVYQQIQQHKTEQAIDIYYKNFMEDNSDEEMNFYVESNFEQDW